MPNIGTLLKSEISRLCRREIRAELRPMRTASAAYRRHIAALKRQVAALERKAALLEKQGSRVAAAAPAAKEGEGARFQARGLRSLRKRLGLSQAAFAKLAGVSPLTVYNWEAGRASPSKSRLAGIVRLRAMGKREVLALLEKSVKRPAEKGSRKAKTRAKSVAARRKRTVRAKRK